MEPNTPILSESTITTALEGALPTDVAKLMVKEVAEIMVSGIVLGSIGAVAGSNLLKSQLFGISRHDSSSTLFIAIVSLTGVTMAAVLGPARKALKISPQQALRVD